MYNYFKAGVRVTDEDRELQENASELIVSLKHGTDSVVEGHIKLFKEQNSLKRQVSFSKYWVSRRCVSIIYL